MNHLRKRLFHLLVISPEDRNPRGKFLAYAISSLIVLNLLAAILETVPAYADRWGTWFARFEFFSVMVFTVEYAVRVWVCVEEVRYEGKWAGRFRYLRSPLAIIDLLAILPFYLPFVITLDLRTLRLLRLFRLFRLFKLGRYLTAIRLFGTVLRTKKEELVLTVLMVLVLVLISASVMYALENEAQPEAFSSIPATLWWAVITLTTVGYGDIYPVTIAGKLVAALISLLGVGLIAMPAAIIAAGFIEQVRSHPSTGHTVCPTCGQPLPDPGPTLPTTPGESGPPGSGR